MIGKKREMLRAPGESLSPKREIILQPVSLKLLALLHCIIAKLERKLRDSGSFSGRKTIVERRQFPIKNPERPAVPDHLVHGKKPHHLFFA
jgi:hypothetical protein